MPADPETEQELSKAGAGVFWSAASRPGLLPLGRADIQFVAEEAASGAVRPTVLRWRLLERCARYSIYAPALT